MLTNSSATHFQNKILLVSDFTATPALNNRYLLQGSFSKRMYKTIPPTLSVVESSKTAGDIIRSGDSSWSYLLLQRENSVLYCWIWYKQYLVSSQTKCTSGLLIHLNEHVELKIILKLLEYLVCLRIYPRWNKPYD